MDKSVSVSLSLEQWNIVGAALNELPRRVSNPVYQEIERQLAMETAKVNPTESLAEAVNVTQE